MYATKNILFKFFYLQNSFSTAQFLNFLDFSPKLLKIFQEFWAMKELESFRGQPFEEQKWMMYRICEMFKYYDFLSLNKNEWWICEMFKKFLGF